MIKIITSRAGYGKTTKLYQMLLEKDKKSKQAFLMVPEQFTLQSELALMQSLESNGLINIQVMSFERLSRLVLSRVGGLKRPYIDEIGKHMALRLIFDKHEEQLPMYKTAYKKEGFLKELSHTLSELKKMAVLPQSLINKSAQIEKNALLKQKLFEIGFIYDEFLKYMDGQYIDNEDRISILAEKINQYEEIADIAFYFDSFTGFTALELSVIEKLAMMKVNLCFALTYDEGSNDSDVFSPTRTTLNQLRTIAKDSNSEFEVESITGDNKKSKEIRYIEQSLYDYKSLPYDSEVADINLFQALDVDKEVEHCALEILSLVRDKGYRFKDILIITPMPQLYARPISRIFTRLNLPYFVDVKRDIMSSPLITLIFSYLDIHIKHLRYEDVFSFLKSDFTDIDETLYMPLENFILKWGIKGSMWMHENRFEEDKFFGPNDLRDEIKKSRDYIVNLYNNNKTVFKSSATGAAYAKGLFEFLISIRAQDKMEGFVSKLREENALDYANENAQIWNIILDTLDQLVEIMGEKKMKLDEFRNILYEGIRQHEIGIIPPALDQVIVATLDRSRSTAIKALFFMGLNDTYVPNIGKDSPILLDDDKKNLKDLGISLPSELDNAMADEMLSIYSALSKANDKLFLSYALSGAEDNKALRPSTIVDRLKKILPKLKEKSSLSDTNIISYISTPSYTFAKLAGELRDLVEDKKPDADILSLYSWYIENKDWEQRRKRLLDNLFYKNQQEYITSSQAKQLYEAPFRASVSRLERFAKCPFDHFVKYGLKPVTREIHEIGPPELGTIFHSAMENFAKLANDKSKLPLLLDKKTCDKQIDSIVDESISNNVRILMDSTKRNAYMLKKIKKIGRRAAWTMINQMNKGRFELYQLEMQVPPIVLDLGEYASIELTGKIDRVDVLNEDEITYVKIIDYKSREKKFSLSDAYNGMDIQLVVYLESVLEHLPKLTKTKAYPAGAFYFPIVDKLIESDLTDVDEIEKLIASKLKMDGIVLKDMHIIEAIDKDIIDEASVIDVKVSELGFKSENALTKEEFDALLNHVMDLVNDMSKEILKGNISIKPYSDKLRTQCTYCEYASMCKFDTLFEGNTYKTVKALKDIEVKELLMGTQTEIKQEKIKAKEEK